MIHLEEINETNWRIDLHVAEDQKPFVADFTTTLARAFAYRNSRSKAYLIKAAETPVGIAMYYDYDPDQAYDFSQFFIDERYQGKGYGYEAVKRILQMMKQEGKYSKVILCYIEGNEAARRLYEKFGFKVTDRDEDEIIMQLNFD